MTTMPHATAMLDEARRIINNDRNAAYGHVRDDYEKVQHIFKALTGVELSLTQCLLFMVSVKMARLRTNFQRDELHTDSLVDALGYLSLITEVRKER